MTSAKNFGELLQDIEIRSRFFSDNSIVLIYDMICLAPIGKFRAAVCMTFTDNLIAKIELFYDTRPFLSKKDGIF